VIDLDALEAAIAEGERKNLFVAPIVKELIAELREARGERAAVVAWLEKAGWMPSLVEVFRRGEHRREEEP
jgi:hypothetical protein